MRVNVDTKIFTDPRMLRLCRALQMPLRHVLGCLVMIWHECYQARSPVMAICDIDAIADHDGFGDAMVDSGLAEYYSPDGLQANAKPTLSQRLARVKGVDARIDFLAKQVDRGRTGGIVRAAKVKETAVLDGQANAKPTPSERLAKAQPILSSLYSKDSGARIGAREPGSVTKGRTCAKCGGHEGSMVEVDTRTWHWGCRYPEGDLNG